MNRAFSLVELSIVLVIVGLLAGGILSGQALIRAAELRAVSTEYSRYLTAIQSFRDRYFALPGDMTNATKFWGTAAAGAICATTASTDKATCDGNGDGIIVGSTNSHEAFRFWQQLANAGMVEGSYNGTSASATLEYVVSAANSPKSKLNSSYWFAYNWGTFTGDDGDRFAITYDNFFMFGGYNGSGAANVARLKPEEAWNIDTKLDDGKPATGKVIGRYVSSCTDTSSSLVLTANYLLTSSAVGCVLIFRQVF